MPRPVSITAPGLLLGVGFGGLVDGVVLHQILQWHHLLSSEGCCPTTTVHGLELNTLADGLFHLVTLGVLLAGGTMVWRRVHDGGARWSGTLFLGLVLEGWGAFNVIEGVIDHQILGLHHVREGPDPFAYDVAFLALGVILALVGHRLARTERTDSESAERVS